jgi:hypothetical protein
MTELFKSFRNELTTLINRHSIDAMVGMPDFVLSKMLCRIIRAMEPGIKKTLDWHGCDSVCHPLNSVHPEKDEDAGDLKAPKAEWKWTGQR